MGANYIYTKLIDTSKNSAIIFDGEHFERDNTKVYVRKCVWCLLPITPLLLNQFG